MNNIKEETAKDMQKKGYKKKLEKYGEEGTKELFSKMGRRGGKRLRKKYGKKHMAEIGRKGALKRWGKKADVPEVKKEEKKSTGSILTNLLTKGRL